ncbi:MAG TPA: imidazole glycerol phosphate synthase cyclase subunit [Solirubrobacteraceae bacterium]|nr:imidazole glycerol phosphate synthase cyclase subunit [Solirubrobacteraceae bacterium]
MLKTRLIPCLLLKNGLLVRSEEFTFHQIVGNPISQVDRFSSWAVDELIYIDITREGEYDMRRDDHKVKVKRDILDIIEDISRSCFMPLTFGGGIRTLEEIRARLAHGADKVTINTMAYEHPEFITDAARLFGSQAIVVSVDVRRQAKGEWEVYTRWGRRATGRSVQSWVQEAERRGAGEIFLNSIDRDGTGTGYDLELVKTVTQATKIPVIACGGVGKFAHLAEGALLAGASAVCAANIFHYTEHSTIRAKKVLLQAGVDVRP